MKVSENMYQELPTFKVRLTFLLVKRTHDMKQINHIKKKKV